MSAHLVPGTVFAGDFRIVRPLARGGMGQVFVAEQISTGRQRALKVMLGDLGESPEPRRRFVQEAKVGAVVESEHVVEVIAAGADTASGALWLAMELLDGEDLKARLERVRTLPPAELLSLFEQIAHALDRAHARGVVHRDLKPENVFISRARRISAPEVVKILDFGIAKLVDEARTSATGAIGTPLWMSPEQSQPGAPITPAADIWPLGLIAFRALVGAPFWLSARGPNMSPMTLMREILIDPIPPASERSRELGAPSPPPGFDAWFARCCARDPRQRFASASAALDALRAVLAAPSAEVAPTAPSAPAAPTLPEARPLRTLGYTEVGQAAPHAATVVTARPVKKSTPWPFVIGAVGLLAGIIMLVTIASSSSSPQAASIVDSARAAAPSQHPKVPSAAPSVKRAPTAAPRVTGPPPGCIDCVKGAVSPALQAAFKPALASMHGCRESAGRSGQPGSGIVVLQVSIGAGGETCSVDVTKDTLNLPDVTSCMVERARAEVWPAPENGCVSVTFPVGF